MAAQLQHWIVTCTTCGNPVEHHCNTCGDILCSKCKEYHEKSNATKHHEIVLYTEQVLPNKHQGQCLDHPGHDHLFWCEKCAKAVCSECVTSVDHAGHKFTKIAAKMEENRKLAKADFGRLSNHLDKWEESLQDLLKEMKDYDNYYDELDKKISKQADVICSHVRKTEAKRRKQLQNMKYSKAGMFQEKKKMLQEVIKGIQKQMKEVEDKLRSEDVEVHLHYATTDVNLTAPSKVNPPPLPIFKHGQLDGEIIEKLIGILVLEEEGISLREDTSSELSSSKSLDREENRRSKKATVQAFGSLGDKTKVISLLQPVSTVATIKTSTLLRLPDIACTDSGQAWVTTDIRRIQLMDRRGKVETTINIDFVMGRMTITQQGNLLATDQSNNCIKSVSKEGIRILFTTESKPFGICLLQNGDMMVTFRKANRVIQYSSSGKMVKELDRSQFRDPKSVTQNKVNQHIYVCDSSVILAFDINGRLQYKYTGSDYSEIDPAGVCTDQAGHVLITDYMNHRVHVLDKDGRFLQYILTKDQGLDYPYTIDADSDGYIWIGEFHVRLANWVKIFKYVQ